MYRGTFRGVISGRLLRWCFGAESGIYPREIVKMSELLHLYLLGLFIR